MSDRLPIIVTAPSLVVSATEAREVSCWAASLAVRDSSGVRQAHRRAQMQRARAALAMKALNTNSPEKCQPPNEVVRRQARCQKRATREVRSGMGEGGVGRGASRARACRAWPVRLKQSERP